MERKGSRARAPLTRLTSVVMSAMLRKWLGGEGLGGGGSAGLLLLLLGLEGGAEVVARRRAIARRCSFGKTRPNAQVDARANGLARRLILPSNLTPQCQ